MDVSIDHMVVRTAGSANSTLHKLIINALPGSLRSVSFETLPALGGYFSSDLTSELVRLAAEHGVDCFYTPPVMPADQFMYDIDVDAVMDFCLRSRPSGGHRVFGGAFLKITATDTVRFLEVGSPICGKGSASVPRVHIRSEHGRVRHVPGMGDRTGRQPQAGL